MNNHHCFDRPKFQVWILGVSLIISLLCLVCIPVFFIISKTQMPEIMLAVEIASFFFLGYTASDLCIFNFSFSILGTKRRRFDKVMKDTLATSKRSWMYYRVSLFPFIYPLVSPFRIEVNYDFVVILLIGRKVFIPLSEVASVEALSDWPSWYEMRHVNPELRHPIQFGDKEIFDVLRQLLEKDGQN